MRQSEVLRMIILMVAATLLALPVRADPVADATVSAVAAERFATAAQKASTAAASSAEAAASAVIGSSKAPATWLLYGVPIVTFVGSIIAIISIRGALKPSTWSLAEALSEEVSMPYYKVTTDGNGAKVRELVLDKEGKPVLLPEMKASTSRVIALLGLIAMLFLFIGFGVFSLFSFGRTGLLPASMDEVVKFLVSGLTLFTPYFVNKIASLFQGLSGGK